MTSIRKARRRLWRWKRYVRKTEGFSCLEPSPGYERARIAWRNEWWRQNPEKACRCLGCLEDRAEIARRKGAA